MAVEVLKITLVVLGYWTISISMVFANKFLLGDRNSKNDISLFIAWIQCMVAVMLIVCRNVFQGVLKNDWSNCEVKDKGPFIRPIMTMTCTYVGMLTFNNLCLKNVGVAFYQVARSLTLIFVVIFSLLILKKNVSLKIVVCCLFVAGGFVLGVDQEHLAGTLSGSGVLFGVITSLFVSLNGIFTKTALDAVDRDSVKLTYYNNINAVVLFLPFVLFTGQFTTALTSDEYQTPVFWLFLIATGGLGFLIAWISAVQIDLTSPVTHHISANAKAVLQTLIAVLYHGDDKSLLWWVSILMVVGGALSYAVVRLTEEKGGSKDEKAMLNGVCADRNRNNMESLNRVELGRSTEILLEGRDRSNNA